MSSLKYWIWLSAKDGVGAVSAKSLIDHFGTPEQVYNAGTEEYKYVEGLKSGDRSKLCDKNLDAANKILAACAEKGCRPIALHDSEYPERLKYIYDPPIVLYVRGRLPAVDELPVIAIVGTRNCTPYGIATAENIACDLARRGFLIATGLARGVDTAAARGALRGGSGVLGVIGSGTDVVYPPENKELYDAVAANGAVISEYPPGTPSLAGHFPARNRIISGLSLGVAVLEAPKKSGALITATRALEQGRDVFAMPGNVDAKSCEGSNALLREGAIPLLSAENIIEEYEDLFPMIVNPEKGIDNKGVVEYIDLDAILAQLEGDERLAAEAIGKKSLLVDDIVLASGLPANRVLSALTMLEIKGCARRAGQLYSLC
ncbi:MAG: DNA-processing protein DprA [Oscillospiraceae bacterium]|nr:DNA-processing protein DprA [Oscillospiraceae bacterium]